MTYTFRHPFVPACWSAVAALSLAACASRPVDAQWTDPQLSGAPLRGAPVLVVCEASEVVVSRLCVDRLSADLRARGAGVVTTLPTSASAAPAGDDTRYVAQARAAGATAVWVASLGPDAYTADYRASPGVSFGLGGFGRGGGVGVGIGVPIGGSSGTVTPRYAADVRVTDVGSGRLLWTARAGSPPAGELSSQIDDLLTRLVGAAGDAKLF